MGSKDYQRKCAPKAYFIVVSTWRQSFPDQQKVIFILLKLNAEQWCLLKESLVFMGMPYSTKRPHILHCIKAIKGNCLQ